MSNYLYPLLFVLMLVQCNDLDPKPRQAPFEKTFTLVKGSEITLTDEDTKEELKVKLEQVYDSRCPTGTMCFTMGNATVILSASNEQEQVKDINLCIGACHPEPVRSKHTIPLQVGTRKYTITLNDVIPYPKAENNDTAKTVEMTVTRSF
ncbi:hypothetical protein [Pontibacter vulgaris]|uniref:hypothetical protein n=1 Tax=Pontibacter vulgaris TaxID=2905679 RepID=UPI001FA7F6F1|nr:hypothetical protein [Pontibacter vulgaris]